MGPNTTISDFLQTGDPLNLMHLVRALLIDAALTFLLAWYYVRFGRTMTNRRVLARTLPFVSLTTVLIISVVKSSIALSLGLVGALSIVRFRTPVKEPEELAYLFMAIAIGLGLGADQHWAVITASILTMLLLLILTWFSRGSRQHNMYLNIDVPDGEKDERTFDRVLNLLAEHIKVADLRRLDVIDGRLHATFLVQCDDDRLLVGAVDHLRANLPGANLSFVDQDQVLGA